MSEDHHHPHKTGHSKVDLFVALAALFMSGLSLYVAMHHGRIMEKMVTASTWPYVQLNTSNAEAGTGAPRVAFSATNSGVGPARVEKVVIRFGDKAILNHHDLLVACCAADGATMGQTFSSFIGHRVLGSQQSVDYLAVRRNEANAKSYEALDQARDAVKVALCYCSVFDECWVARSDAPNAERVESCAALAGEPYAE